MWGMAEQAVTIGVLRRVESVEVAEVLRGIGGVSTTPRG
jgi:hypothetical protein